MRPIRQIGDGRDIAGRLEGKSPAGLALRFGALARRREGTGRQTSELRFVRNHQLKRIGGIQNIFGEFCCAFRQFHVHFGQTVFAGRVQLRAAAAERIERLGEEALLRTRERFCLVGFGVPAQLLPETFVEGNSGEKFAGFGFHFVPGGAHGGRCGDRFQMPHNSHGVAKRLRRLFQRQHGVGESSLRFVRRYGVNARLGVRQELANARDDVLRAHLVERDRKFDGKKGIIGHSIAEVPDGLYVILPPHPG